MSLLEVKNLKKYFPILKGIFRREVGNVKAVDDISFSVKEGEVLGIVGESGSGKSTAARAAIRLIEPTAGEISFCNQDLSALSSRELRNIRKEVQIVFQDPFASLNPRKSVIANIGEALLYHKIALSRDDCREKVVEALHQVGIEPSVLNRYPHEFSGGQQQRICIARAVALKPKLIICDEVVSALDVSVQAQILNLLQELKKELKLSYVFIAHDLAVVRHLCDSVLVMYKGKIVEENKTAELFADPKHQYTKKLLSAIPRDFPE